MKPTNIILSLADRSLTYPHNIIEDILVKLDKFIFPIDFVVLDMKEDQNVALTLGRPFLVISIIKIDVQEKLLVLKAENKKVIFNIYKPTL